MKEITAKIDKSEKAIVYNDMIYYAFSVFPRPFYAENIKTGERTIFPTQLECQRELNINHTSISGCLAKTQKTSNGYIFRYL